MTSSTASPHAGSARAHGTGTTGVRRTAIRWTSGLDGRRRVVGPDGRTVRKGSARIGPKSSRDAEAADLAAGEEAKNRAEAPRTDAKIVSLLSVLTALIATGGLITALLVRKALSPWAAGTLGAASLLAWTTLITLMLLMIPRTHGAQFARIAQMTTGQAVTHYRRRTACHHLLTHPVGKAGDSLPSALRRRVRVAGELVHHARQAVNSAAVTARRFRLIQWAGWLEVGAVVLLPFGLLALFQGW